MKYLYLFLVLSLPLPLFSQSANPSLTDIVPPLPKAHTIETQNSINVGYASVVPSIEILLYSYKNPDNSLHLTISLNYANGGVRVNDVASNIGIGWSLQAGGAISRTLRGMPDELSFGFLNYSFPKSEREGNTYYLSTTAFQQINASTRDGKSDVFNYNFNGRSGKFILGKNNDVLQLNSSNLKISKVISNVPGMLSNPVISQFKIKTEKGVTYIFNALESVLSLNVGWPSSKQYVSTWYLTKIISPFNRDTININYEDEQYQYNVMYNDSYTIGLNGFDSKHDPTTTLTNQVQGGLAPYKSDIFFKVNN